MQLIIESHFEKLPEGRTSEDLANLLVKMALPIERSWRHILVFFLNRNCIWCAKVCNRCACNISHICLRLNTYNYTPHTMGVYWFHSVRLSVHLSVRLSVRPASRVRFVAPTVLAGFISYLYILSSTFRRCVVCKVSCKISKFEFLAIF